jgi:hydroxymethylpyrimidine kinase/phosphomethylpyrimidine kinase
MTIAGSDSGGGAGLQADLRTFAALGVFGTCAVTAVTAQNTTAVLGVRAMEPAFVAAQIEAVLSDLHPMAVKTGMLATAGTVAAVAELAAGGVLPHLVVDPVLVSTSGHRLMDDEGLESYRRLLLPHAEVATPNLREAAVLTGRTVTDLSSVGAMTSAAQELRSLGVGTVVVKGGHLARSPTGSPDVVAGPDGTVVLPAPRVATSNDHGTGCSLSAAIAAFLAAGRAPFDAVAEAKSYVHGALLGAASWRLGAGHGPIDHMGWTRPAPGS